MKFEVNYICNGKEQVVRLASSSAESCRLMLERCNLKVLEVTEIKE